MKMHCLFHHDLAGHAIFDDCYLTIYLMIFYKVCRLIVLHKDDLNDLMNDQIYYRLNALLSSDKAYLLLMIYLDDRLSALLLQVFLRVEKMIYVLSLLM